MKRKLYTLLLLWAIVFTGITSCEYHNDDDQNNNGPQEEVPTPYEPEPEWDEVYLAAVSQPNCYMVRPGSSVSIPVMKAFAIWTIYAGELYEVSLNGLPPVPELLWQDAPGLITSIGLLENAGQNSQIAVATAAGKSGNAVVVVKFGGVIRWGWHIWVTDYDPDKWRGGRTFAWDNNGDGEVDYIFMDRNLGAQSDGTKLTRADSLAAYGLYYQYGRKDPLPQDVSGTDLSLGSRPLYDFAGYPLPCTGSHGSDGMRAEFTRAIDQSNISNLARVIENPLTMYVGRSPVSETGDWYSYREPRQCNDELWEKNGAKSPFDPCPAGWQVPPNKHTFPEYANHPWNSELRMPWWQSFVPVAPLYCPLGVLPFNGIVAYSGFGGSEPQVSLTMAGSRYSTTSATPATFYGNGARNTYSLLIRLDNGTGKLTGYTNVSARNTATGIRCVREDKK